MGAGEFTAKTVRHVFFVRDGERCFRCRKPLRFEERGFAWSMHHRLPRGAGGVGARKGSPYEQLVAGPANAITLCGSGVTGCHGWAEKYRDTARHEGYLIPRLGLERDPGGIKVKRRNGVWVLLTRSGLAIDCDEPEEEEL